MMRLALILIALTMACRPLLAQQYLPPIVDKVPADNVPADSMAPGAVKIEQFGADRPPSRFWFGAEYLLWSIRPADVPPLVTTGPQAGNGVLGQPGTTTLFGGNAAAFPLFSGGRFTAGYWFDYAQKFGVEGGFFFLGQNSSVFSASSNGDPLLARPFTNALTGAQDSELVARAGDPANPLLIPLTGKITVTMTSQLNGADLNGIANVYNGSFAPFGSSTGGLRVDLLGGFRYLYLAESLVIEEDLQVPNSSLLIPGSTFKVIDQFSTKNWFYGGQIGARVHFDYQRWELGATGKLALGVTQQEVNISGFNYTNDPSSPPPVSTNVGHLASTSNIGTYSRDAFTVVPELDLTIGYRLTDHVKLFAGYSFLYWSDVARPGDQIDLRLNPNQIPLSGMSGGPALPAFSFHGTPFWAQGVNFGVEFRF